MSHDRPEVLKAVSFREEFRTGAGTPLLVDADDGQPYVVKLAGSGEGVTSLIVEWVALKLGVALGLPVLDPQILSVGPGVTSQIRDVEVREVAERISLPGLATRWQEATEAVAPGHLSSLGAEERSCLFFFDLLLMNVDRTDENPNAFLSKGRIWFLDYSSALELRRILGKGDSNGPQALREMRRHLLFTPDADLSSFLHRVDGIPERQVEEVVGGLPTQWLEFGLDPGGVEPVRAEILEGLKRVLDRAEETLRGRMESLREMHVETKEERRARSAANRNRLSDLVGGL